MKKGYSINDDNWRELYERILDSSSAAIYVCDAETKELLYVNERLAQMSNKSKEEAVGKTCYEFIKRKNCACDVCFCNLAKSEKSVDREYYSEASGKTFWTSGKLIDWCGRPAFLEFIFDDTERTEEKLTIQALLDGIPGGVGIFSAYADGSISVDYLNNGYYSLLGDSRVNRQSALMNPVMMVHPDDRLAIKHETAAAIAENREANVDVRICMRDGRYSWMNVKAAIARKEGDCYKMYAFYSDIDTLKRAQIMLQSNQKAMEIACQNSAISMWIFDLDRRAVLKENRINEKLESATAEANIPERLIETGAIYPEDVDGFLKMYQDLFDGAENVSCKFRKRVSTADFEWCRINYFRIHDDKYPGRVAIGFLININEQQRNVLLYEREVQLRQTLIRNAVSYYRINLSTDVLEEYVDTQNDTPGIHAPTVLSDEIRAELLSNVKPEDRNIVETNVFSHALKEQYRKGETNHQVSYRRMVDGRYHWITVTINILKNPDANEVIAFLYSNDNDKEKKDNMALESVLNDNIDAVLMLDTVTGLVHPVGRAESERYESKEVSFIKYGKEYAETVVYEGDRELFKKFFAPENIKKELSKSDQISHRYRMREGTKLYYKNVTMFYLDETEENIVITTQDITDVYNEEQRQKRILQQAADAANKANAAKSEFLSRMSHDMRTPLNAILSFTSEEMTADITDEQKNAYIKKVHTSGEYLLSIINDVLDMSKIESKKMILNPTPYRFDEFADTINTVIGQQCKTKNITFTFDVKNGFSEALLLDKVRFNQVFVNLLSNSIKYTPEGGTVELHSETLEINGGRIHSRYTVRDNGIGMSPDFLPHAFDSFSQENRDVTKINQGTGLGLSIVKQIVELMGGTIEMQSELNVGTTTTITMWADIARPETAVKITEEDLSKLKGVRVLLCEDQPINAEICRRLLEMKGCIMEEAGNGQIGLETFEKSAVGYYEIVLMDLRMPILDGLHATKAIRMLNRPDAKTVPIIALTADAFNEDAKEALESGMNGHLIKPINTKELYQTILRKTGRL